MYCSYKIRP